MKGKSKFYLFCNCEKLKAFLSIEKENYEHAINHAISNECIL